jgi:predicted enzyme related to lactoylglutathione lyase
MPRVIHFEIAADDPERAAAFYRKVFGWEIRKWDGPMEYWVITTGPKEEPGIDGGLGRRTEPGAGTENTIAVDSVDRAVENVVAGGGKVTRPNRRPRRWLARLLRGYGGEPVRLVAGRSLGKIAHRLPPSVVAWAHAR